jgi:hypothetical protein
MGIRIVVNLTQAGKDTVMEHEAQRVGVVTANEEKIAGRIVQFLLMFGARMAQLASGKPLETLLPKALWKPFGLGKDLPK